MEDGLITETMLDEALSFQKSKGGKIVEVLIALGHLKMDDFITFLSRQPGIASINLDQYQISPQTTGLVPRAGPRLAPVLVQEPLRR